MDCTPRIALLATRLQELSTDLSKNLDSLSKKLGISLQPITNQVDEDILILEAAVHNIVDRNKEKKALKKRLKVEVKEIQTYPIDPSEYSVLDPDFTE